MTDQLQCDKCGAEVNQSLKFCGMCGASTQPPSDIKCPECGHENPPEFTFCGECGASLTTEEEVLENETEDAAATVLDDEVDPNRSGEESSSDSEQESSQLEIAGLEAIHAGDFERAVELLDEAIRLDPQAATTYNLRGWTYGSLGRFERAIQDLDKAIELDSQLAAAYNNRGWAYRELREYERAIDSLDEAIRLDPELASAYANRGGSYSSLGHQGKADQDYEVAARLEPDSYSNLTRGCFGSVKAFFGMLFGLGFLGFGVVCLYAVFTDSLWMADADLMGLIMDWTMVGGIILIVLGLWILGTTQSNPFEHDDDDDY